MRTAQVLSVSVSAVAMSAVMFVTSAPGRAQAPAATPAAPAGPREVPARALPEPTWVTPETARGMSRGPGANWNVIPVNDAEWAAAAGRGAGAPGGIGPGNQATLDKFGLTSESISVNGVAAYLITPKDIAPENRNRLLVHVHGGCYVMGGGGVAEGALMAGFGKFKVLSIDYRRPPFAFYPAALDDVVNAWKGAIRMADPKNMALFGLSAGGALTLSAIHRFKREGVPLPAAIAPGTPMSDLTRKGDTLYTNHMVDNVLVGIGRCDAMAEYYARGAALTDPMLSPIFGDFTGFPPAILMSGTRDLLLSSTVRTHRKLRQAGVVAELHVFEGHSHAQYNSDTPDGREAYEEIARFFDRHLGK
jgi:monoterpene epsilon-lactone hydrolase